jgi:predicted transcriptional regulator
MKKTKTKMRATSLEVFFEILPTLENRELEVLKALKHLKMANNLMISNYLHLPVNCVTGRIYSLRELGIVLYYKKDICPFTGKKTIYWKIKDYLNQVMVEQ